MSNRISDLVKDIQYSTDLTIAEIAKSIGYSGPHLNRSMKGPVIEKLYNALYNKYSPVLTEFRKKTPSEKLDDISEKAKALLGTIHPQDDSLTASEEEFEITMKKFARIRELLDYLDRALEQESKRIRIGENEESKSSSFENLRFVEKKAILVKRTILDMLMVLLESNEKYLGNIAKHTLAYAKEMKETEPANKKANKKRILAPVKKK